MPRIRKRRLKEVAKIDLDAGEVHVSDQKLAVRALLRKAKEARTDLSTFYSLVIKHELTKEPLKPAPHQEVMFSFFDKHPRCVFRIPIGCAKTFSMAAITLHLLGNDVTQRGAIVSKTRGQAEKVLAMVSDYITDPDLSAALMLVFPWLKKPIGANTIWSQSKISIVRPAGIRDPSLVAIGIDGAIAGARVSWLVADDCIDDENSRSMDVREATAAKFDGRLMSRLDPHGSRAVVTNTPWDKEDLTYHLEEVAGWPTLTMDIYGNVWISNADASWLKMAEQEFVRPSTIVPDAYRLKAHDPDPEENTLLFPERYTPESVAEIKRRMLPHEFARLMLCQPFDSETARCQRAWLELCKKRGLGTSLVEKYNGENPTYTGVDLAIGTKLKHDKTVFFTFEYLPDGSKRILDIESGRWEGPIIIDKMVAKVQAYNSVIAVETVAAQDYIRQFALKQKRDLQVFAHNTGTNKTNVNYGVESMFTEFKNSAWIIPCDANGVCHPEVQKFIDGAIFYQPAPAHTSDHLMAAWIGRERARKTQFRDAPPKRGKLRPVTYQGGF